MPLVLLLLLAAFAFWSSEVDASIAPGLDPGDDPPPPEPWPDAGGTWVDAVMGTLGAGTTRGERNNNPGNIRHSSSTWVGQVAGTDPAFVTFDTAEHGIRALAVLLRNYSSKYGLNTIRGIINRYAPPVENNTSSYVAAVAADMGVSADAALDLSDDAVLRSLVAAIIKHENGRVSYADATIAQGVSLA